MTCEAWRPLVLFLIGRRTGWDRGGLGICARAFIPTIDQECQARPRIRTFRKAGGVGSCPGVVRNDVSRSIRIPRNHVFLCAPQWQTGRDGVVHGHQRSGTPNSIGAGPTGRGAPRNSDGMSRRRRSAVCELLASPPMNSAPPRLLPHERKRLPMQARLHKDVQARNVPTKFILVAVRDVRLAKGTCESSGNRRKRNMRSVASFCGGAVASDHGTSRAGPPRPWRPIVSYNVLGARAARSGARIVGVRKGCCRGSGCSPFGAKAAVTVAGTLEY